MPRGKSEFFTKKKRFTLCRFAYKYMYLSWKFVSQVNSILHKLNFHASKFMRFSFYNIDLMYFTTYFPIKTPMVWCILCWFFSTNTHQSSDNSMSSYDKTNKTSVKVSAFNLIHNHRNSVKSLKNYIMYSTQNIIYRNDNSW